MGERQPIYSLQAGRALAALSVVMFHLSLILRDGRYAGMAVFEPLTRFGYRGVDYFFVLSGFIILYAHAADIGVPERLGRYAWKRFSRVFPAYWLYTGGLVVLVAAGLGTAITLPATGAGWLSVFTLVRTSSEGTPLAVAWTLFHEIAFYALFGVLIWNRRAGVIAMGGWALLCLALLHWPPGATRTPYDAYTAGYNLNFMIGMGGYWLWSRINGRQALALLLAGVLAAGAALALEYAGTAIPLLYAFGFAGVLVGLAGLERAGALSIPRALVFLGNASFTVYLVHIPLIGLGAKILKRIGLLHLGGEAYYAGVMAFALVGAMLAYVFVEKPLLGALRSGVRWRAARALPA